jgi:hypothetical protein
MSNKRLVFSGLSGAAPESPATSNLSASRGSVASVPPLFSCGLQLPVPLGLNLLLMPSEHVLQSDVTDGAVETHVVVIAPHNP